MSELPLLLDTHVWLWTLWGDKTVGEPARKRIALALKSSRVLISAISVWEAGMLWKKNRVQLRMPLSQWIQQSFHESGYSLLPLNDVIAAESCVLPGAFHSDPADCIIVASARIEQAVLLTRDARIIEYSRVGHVSVLPV